MNAGQPVDKSNYSKSRLGILLSYLRIFVLVVLSLMILFRLIWMDLRVYEFQFDPLALISLEAVNKTIPSCNFNLLNPEGFSPQVSKLSSWPKSKLYQIFVSLSCSPEGFSKNAYIRMNQGLYVICIVICLIIARLYSRSWILILAVAAMLLSRGRLNAMHSSMSSYTLTTVLISLWCLSLLHFIRSGSKTMLVLQQFFLILLISLENSLWILFWLWPTTLALAWLAKGIILRPLLSRLRIHQKVQREKKKTLSNQRSVHVLGDELWRWSDQVKLWLGVLRPARWHYKPLTEQFRTGSLLRPLNVSFSLWLFADHHFRRLLKPTILIALTASCLVFIFALSQQISSFNSEDLIYTSILSLSEFFIPLDLDLKVCFFIITASILAGPGKGVSGYWESSVSLALCLCLSLVGVILWENLDSSHLARASWILRWFEPTLLTFSALGLYHLLRIFDAKWLTKDN